MLTASPKQIIITEDFPVTVSQYRVSAKSIGGTELAAANYGVTGTVTTIPIGSNGFFNPVPDGTVVNLFVQEIAAPGHGDNPSPQMAPGGPFTVVYLADGAENIEVVV